MRLRDGWLERQFKKVNEEFEKWPAWMRREAGYGVPMIERKNLVNMIHTEAAMSEHENLKEAMTLRMSNLLDVEKAARDLYRKLLVVHEDPQYQGVWSLSYIHGEKYTAPNYGPEMEALRVALGEEKT